MARVRDADLLSVARQPLELLPPPADEPKRQAELAGLLDHEASGVPGRPQHRERAFSAHVAEDTTMEMEAKEFTYDVLLEDGGVMLADGTGAIDAPEAWKPDHFLVAALLRCTLQSLRYHADRAGLEASGRGEGRALVTKRAEDERYAVVEIVVSYDIALESDPGDEGVAELLAKAERDCFVGASLTVEPEYRWNVNGRTVSARAAPS